MSPLLLTATALLLGALGVSVALWVRSGETRVGWFGALFAALAVHAGLASWTHWGESLGPGASLATALTALAIGLLAVASVVALWRTLGERDRAESLHWDSMEAVRVMNELSASSAVPFDAKIERLLALGCARFGLEIGMVSRVHKDRYEVLAVRAPADFPVASGAVFALGETFCANTVESERPIAVEHVSESTWSGRLDRAAFRFDAYFGAAVRVAGLPHGTLCFAGRAPHKERFTATDKDLLRLMAQWLGNETERRDGVHAYVEPPASPPEPVAAQPPSQPSEAPVVRAETDEPEPAARPAAPPRPRRGPSRRVVDANQVLRRIEKDLRNLAGPAIAFELALDDALGLAAVQRVPLDAIVRTLVMNARDAMPDGGTLRIETANLEISAGEPGVVPAVAPDRYVTVAVRDSGAEPDADTLSRLYEPGIGSDALHVRDPGGRLALSTVYRVLQVCGGDLSVDVEPGRGSTFTVYLPRARDAAFDAAPARADTRAEATTPPLPLH